MRQKGWIWAIAALLFFQASDVTLRWASVNVHFMVGTVVQAMPLLIAATIIALIGVYRDRGRTAVLNHDAAIIERGPKAGVFENARRRGWTMAVLYGCLQFFIGNMLFFASVQLGGLSIASPSVQSQAIWAVIIGGLFLREKISRAMLAGIGIFIIGIFTLTWFKTTGSNLEGHWFAAAIIGMLGGLAWASASAVQRFQLQKGMRLSSLLALGALTGVVLLNVNLAVFYDVGMWRTLDVHTVLKLLAAGSFNAMAIGSIAQALKTLEISKVIPVIALNIVFNTLNGGLLFNEYISIGTIGGMLATLIGVLIVQELWRSARGTS